MERPEVPLISLAGFYSRNEAERAKVVAEVRYESTAAGLG